MSLVKKAKGLQRFMLDCGFWRSPKYSGVSLAAIGLQTCAISYCYEHGTDGLVPGDPETLAMSLGVRERDVRKAMPELVDRGRWIEHGDSLEVVGYLDHNPSRDEVAAYRQKRATASLKGNHERWHTKDEDRDPECPFCVPASSESESGKRSDSDHTTDALRNPKAEESRGSRVEEPSSSSDSDSRAAPLAEPEEEDQKLRDLATALGEHDAKGAKGAGVRIGKFPNYARQCARTRIDEQEPDLRKLIAEHPAWPIDRLFRAVIGDRSLPQFEPPEPVEFDPEALANGIASARQAMGA
jgi:hypothetical protein